MTCRMACTIECTVACAHSCQNQCLDVAATTAIARYERERAALEEVLNSGSVGLVVCESDKKGYVKIPE